jgi:hypothetical protein
MTGMATYALPQLLAAATASQWLPHPVVVALLLRVLPVLPGSALKGAGVTPKLLLYSVAVARVGAGPLGVGQDAGRPLKLRVIVSSLSCVCWGHGVDVLGRWEVWE